ncbi:hypothetical protein WICMUC_002033 [Wickerhamomyces mucosus]|uniref:Exosome complex component CSL4 C-terminal domain-containing protein n=1 Tax=Wickerhamomyces mucosus TaxID=1378264 RepID=A0A9P8PQV4_9ASCO|nr:hypothetical protein WICMUC_002033 [Wickerhamomyces mucosus]
MTIDIPKYTFPGQPLSPVYQSSNNKSIIEYIPGNGTILSKINNIDVINSTLLGNVKVNEVLLTDEEVAEKTISQKFKIEVINNKQNEYSELNDNGIIINNTYLPKEGDIVLVRVLKISLKQANVEIIAIENSGNISKESGIGMNGYQQSNVTSGSNGQFLSIINNGLNESGENFRGIIRVQDIRSTEKDKVKIVESFKPNDIIRAKVLSIGDGQNYYLTTNENEFGVVFAKSQNGNGQLMYPIDWQNMIVPSTGEIELRKCAKPF